MFESRQKGGMMKFVWLDGKGHYIWKETGQQYDGDYKNGLMHGKGLFEYSEGEYYRGDFVNGKKEKVKLKEKENSKYS